MGAPTAPETPEAGLPHPPTGLPKSSTRGHKIRHSCAGKIHRFIKSPRPARRGDVATADPAWAGILPERLTIAHGSQRGRGRWVAASVHRGAADTENVGEGRRRC